jgi:sulfite exporter TauE/SafE
LSDHFSHLLDASLYALPWLAFLAGLGGSLHCVGMCGGLVSACSPDKKSIWIYQVGRLLGYSLLGIFAGTIGHLISQSFQNNFLKLAPALTLGFLFILWGWTSLKGKKEIATPGFIQKTYNHIWKTIMPNMHGNLKPFGVGFFSIMLPCGLLYALVISVAAFQDPAKGLMAMFFFWLGTIPAMALAPNLFQLLMQMFFNRSPRLIGATFMVLGILTISYRLFMLYSGEPTAEGPSCH